MEEPDPILYLTPEERGRIRNDAKHRETCERNRKNRKRRNKR